MECIPVGYERLVRIKGVRAGIVQETGLCGNIDVDVSVNVYVYLLAYGYFCVCSSEITFVGVFVFLCVHPEVCLLELDQKECV